ncbi:unnamed protein product, partial [Lampetra planeri]
VLINEVDTNEVKAKQEMSKKVENVKMETRRTNRTRSPHDASSDSPVGAAGGAEDVGVLPAAPPPAVQPIAASDATQAAHARLAQLLHAAAAILEQLTLGAAGGEERPTAGVPAIANPEENVLPADGSRGGGSQVYAGTSGGQSQHTASSQSDAASAGSSSNTASSRLPRRTAEVNTNNEDVQQTCQNSKKVENEMEEMEKVGERNGMKRKRGSRKKHKNKKKVLEETVKEEVAEREGSEGEPMQEVVEVRTIEVEMIEA